MYTTRPAAFDYHRPTSVDEAVALLSQLDDARPLAGGHSLLPAMKLRWSTPSALVDIGRIPGLDAIEADGDGLRIGALATHASVAASELVASRAPALADAAAMIGDRQVRNRGTIGGSLAHSDPGADYPTVVAALGARIAIAGSGGTRDVAAAGFFTGLFATALQPGELVTAVRVPAVPGSAYVKHKHPASGYAVVGAAAAVTADGTKLVIGGVTGVPVDVPVGPASPDGIPAAVRGALTNVIGDTYASAEYRTHLATVLARRALAKASGRAG